MCLDSALADGLGRVLPDFLLYKPRAVPQDRLAHQLGAVSALGAYIFLLHLDRSCHAQSHAHRPHRPAPGFTGPGGLGGFCFASFSRAFSSFSPRFSMRSLDCRRLFLLALVAELLDFGTFCPEVAPALLVFPFMGHILRAGGQQVIDLTLAGTDPQTGWSHSHRTAGPRRNWSG